MDPVSPTETTPVKADQKPSFRRPSNDAAHRKYRRHSPGGSNTSSSDDDSKKEGARIERERRDGDRGWRKKDDSRELKREHAHSRSDRGSDYYRQYDKRSYGSSRDSGRHDDYQKIHSYVDDGYKKCEISSRSSRDSRGGMRDSRGGLHNELSRYDNNDDKSREHWRNGEKHSKGRYDHVDHRSKDRGKEMAVSEFLHNGRDSAMTNSGDRHNSISRYDSKTSDKDRYADKGGHIERKDQRRSPETYKYDKSLHEESRFYRKDPVIERENCPGEPKETHKRSNNESNKPMEKLVQKKKNLDGETEKDIYSKEAESDVRDESRILISHGMGWKDETANKDSSAKRPKLGSSETCAKQSSSSKFTTGHTSSTTDEGGASQDVDAAKVAAMKAAELVNKNLTGVGGACLSTDQKKKLLWGSKKSNTSEESSNRWGLPVFSDQARQEKFNKLMGVKGDTTMVSTSDQNDAEKQKDLDVDLEKQYTAGLRRRDGRTVGLGL